MSQLTEPDSDAISAAIAMSDGPLPGPVKFIDYEVQHCVLLVGPALPVFDMARSLRHQFDVVAVIDGPRPESRLLGVSVISAQQVELSGYLGRFSASAKDINGQPIDLGKKSTNEDGCFDLVLDLSASPILDRPVPPLGYLRPGDHDQYKAVLADIPKLSDAFRKPKYFNFEPGRCVHRRQQLAGCDRCLQVCPAEAITSGEQTVVVEPHLCRGCGSCTAVCPTGAISYADPPIAAVTDRLHQMLQAYKMAGGTYSSTSPWIGFHADDGAQMEQWASNKGIILLPFPLHAPGSLGLEILLAPIALGAGGVVLSVSDGIPPMVVQTLTAQAELAREILCQLGNDNAPVRVLDGSEDDSVSISSESPNYIANDDDWPYPSDNPDPRERLLMVFGHLSSQADQCIESKSVELPAWTMFGGVELHRDACTMCMACTNLCPTGALNTGIGDSELSFVEASCIQCGLCERGCPEAAITRRPRFNYQSLFNRNAITLNHANMANCIQCGKPYMSSVLLSAVKKHLSGNSAEILHAKQMLQVCPQCRANSVMQAQFPEIPGNHNE